MRAWLLTGVLGLVVGSWVTTARAQDDLNVQSLMAIAKMSGACGILDSQLTFQQTTKLPGGDEFVVRFWRVEATRLGLAMQEYSDRCDQAIAAYDRLWKASEPILK